MRDSHLQCEIGALAYTGLTHEKRDKMIEKAERKMSFPKTMQESFKDLPDPRTEKKTANQLIDIVVVAICAVISGAESWTEI